MCSIIRDIMYCFIIDYYLPKASANGNCVSRLATEMASRGREVCVVAQKHEIFDSEDEYIDDIRVLRCSTHFNNLYIKTLDYAQNGGIIGLLCIILKSLLRSWKYTNAILGEFTITNAWLESYEEVLVKLQKEYDSMVLIPCCFPMEAVLSAAKFKEKNKGVFFMPWLIDNFAQSSTLHRTNWNKKRKFDNNVALEKYVLNQSNKVLYFEPWEKHLMNISHENQKNVKIGLPLIVPRLLTKSTTSGLIKLVYMGSLLKKERNPDVALKVLNNFMGHYEGLQFDIYHMGDCNDIIRRYANANHHIINHGSVSNRETETAMDEADVLILIGNNHPVQIPSKMYEYISTGKAIIFFMKDASDPVLNVLKLYGKAFVIDESKSENLDYDSLCTFVERRNDKANEIAYLYEENTPSFIADVIEKAISEEL